MKGLNKAKFQEIINYFDVKLTFSFDLSSLKTKVFIIQPNIVFLMVKSKKV